MYVLALVTIYAKGCTIGSLIDTPHTAVFPIHLRIPIMHVMYLYVHCTSHLLFLGLSSQKDE